MRFDVVSSLNATLYRDAYSENVPSALHVKVLFISLRIGTIQSFACINIVYVFLNQSGVCVLK